MKRENQDLKEAFNGMEDKCKLLEKQREKDCDYILKQESEIEKQREAK